MHIHTYISNTFIWVKVVLFCMRLHHTFLIACIIFGDFDIFHDMVQCIFTCLCVIYFIGIIFFLRKSCCPYTSHDRQLKLVLVICRPVATHQRAVQVFLNLNDHCKFTEILTRQVSIGFHRQANPFHRTVV